MCGAKSSPSRTNPTRTKPITVITVEKTRQPSSSFFSAAYFAKTGIKVTLNDPPRNQIIQKIRQSERRVVSVRNRIRPHLVRQGPIAKKSQHAAQQYAGHHDPSGRSDATVHRSGI